MDSNFSPERAYSVDDRGLRVPLPAPDPERETGFRLTRATSFAVILLVSLGLWASIWAAVGSFTSFVIR